MAAVLGDVLYWLATLIAGITIGVAFYRWMYAPSNDLSKFGFFSRSASSRGFWAARYGTCWLQVETNDKIRGCQMRRGSFGEGPGR